MFCIWTATKVSALITIGQTPSPTWFKRYWTLIDNIQALLNLLNMPLLQVSFIHEAQVLTLKICITFTLGALVDLYAVFAPYQSEPRSKHCDAVKEMAAVCSTFSLGDYQYLDCGLGVRHFVLLHLSTLIFFSWLCRLHCARCLTIPRSKPLLQVRKRAINAPSISSSSVVGDLAKPPHTLDKRFELSSICVIYYKVA